MRQLRRQILQFSAYEYSTLICELDASIAFVSLNRPDKGNALNEKMIAELTQVLSIVQQDSSLRALCISAQGKHFCTGADLHDMQASIDYSLAKNIQEATKLAQLMQLLSEMELPVIAQVHGAVYGGAIGILANCDIVIAHTDTSFCLSEVKLGLVPAVISPYVIAALGMRQAKRLMLTAEKFNAQQAEKFGLVHEVVAGDLATAVDARIDSLLQNGPHAMRSVKKLCRELPNMQSVAARQQFTANLIARVRIGQEAQEGLRDFFEKKNV